MNYTNTIIYNNIKKLNLLLAELNRHVEDDNKERMSEISKEIAKLADSTFLKCYTNSSSSSTGWAG